MERKSLSAKRDQNAFKTSPSKKSRAKTAIKALSSGNRKLYKVVIDDKLKRKFKEKKSGIPRYTKEEYEAFVCEVEGKQVQANHSSQKFEGGQFQYPPNQAQTDENEENICTEGRRKHNLVNGDENSARNFSDIHSYAYDSGKLNQKGDKKDQQSSVHHSNQDITKLDTSEPRSESKKLPTSCSQSTDPSQNEKSLISDLPQSKSEYRAKSSLRTNSNSNSNNSSKQNGLKPRRFIYLTRSCEDEGSNSRYARHVYRPKSLLKIRPRSCEHVASKSRCARIGSRSNSLPNSDLEFDTSARYKIKSILCSDDEHKPSGFDLKRGGFTEFEGLKPRSMGSGRNFKEKVRLEYRVKNPRGAEEEIGIEGIDPNEREGLIPKVFVGQDVNGQGVGSSTHWINKIPTVGRNVREKERGEDVFKATNGRLSAGKRVEDGTVESKAAKNEIEYCGSALKGEGVGNGCCGHKSVHLQSEITCGTTTDDKEIKSKDGSWTTLLKTNLSERIQVSYQAPNVSNIEVSYIAPKPNQQRGKVCPPQEITKAGSAEFNFTLVGYLFDTKLPFSLVRNTTMRYWSTLGLRDMLATDSGFYFFQFNNLDQCKVVLERGPWHIAGHPLILRQWHSGLKMKKEAIKSLPVWVNIYDVPLEYWNSEGLSCIGSSIGKPLQVDRITSMRSRISYARMCIEIDADEPLLEELDLIVQNPITKKQDSIPLKLEYRWRPRRCGKCKIFGHDCEVQQQQKVDKVAMDGKLQPLYLSHEYAGNVRHQQKEDKATTEQPLQSKMAEEWQIKGNRKNAKATRINLDQKVASSNSTNLVSTTPMITLISNTGNRFAVLQECDDGDGFVDGSDSEVRADENYSFTSSKISEERKKNVRERSHPRAQS